VVLTGKVERLFGVDYGGTRSHAGGGMNQMPIAFSLQKGTRGAVFWREERGEWGKVK
jgi:hypothetical protein